MCILADHLQCLEYSAEHASLIAETRKDDWLCPKCTFCTVCAEYISDVSSLFRFAALFFLILFNLPIYSSLQEYHETVPPAGFPLREIMVFKVAAFYVLNVWLKLGAKIS